MQRYKLSPNWVISYNNSELTINGGADNIYYLALPLGDASFFSKLDHDLFFTRTKVKKEQDIFEQLLAAQIITPVIPNIKRSSIGIYPAKASKLFSTIHFVPAEKANFMVYVRTNQTFAKFLFKADYMNIRKPHLFVDLAYNQVISIGPLVFPGETSCISCLQGRITNRWGDPELPPRPRMTEKDLRLTESIILSEIDRLFEEKDYSLINTTVSWDIKGRNIDTHPLLTVPFCPVCNKTDFASIGQLVI